MKDSILKGTGNSRFLKSAVPAGTSWADALAMLQAGTFPIDFNGINAEGFQQVGTPLNKANLLKDATAAQIGLPPSTTPDDMFQALGNTGELHVWRKTARDASVSAPGYNLGDIKSLTDICQAPSGYQGYFGVKAEYSDEVTVNNFGVISLVSPSEIELGFTGKTAVFLPEGADNTLKNKFLKIVSVLAEQPNAKILDSYKDAVIHCESNFHCSGYGNSSPGYNIYFNNFRLVTPYPAGLSTTYPVSTNPNAYQEGDDAKPAGYTLGKVVTGKVLASKCYNNTAIHYGKTVSVSDDGIVSILNPTTRTLSSTLSSAEIAAIKDGFVYVSGNENYSDVSSAFRYGNIVYIPADASVSTEYANSAYGVYIDRYQPVTGYAAIPAGTTIEYLGKLGDKARVQVVSYVGTGTYGADNPNSLTFDFVPKVVMIRRGGDTKVLDAIYGMRDVTVVLSAGYYVTVEWSKKTLSWYSSNSAGEQMNYAGYKYYAAAIG